MTISTPWLSGGSGLTTSGPNDLKPAQFIDQVKALPFGPARYEAWPGPNGLQLDPNKLQGQMATIEVGSALYNLLAPFLFHQVQSPNNYSYKFDLYDSVEECVEIRAYKFEPGTTFDNGDHFSFLHTSMTADSHRKLVAFWNLNWTLSDPATMSIPPPISRL